MELNNRILIVDDDPLVRDAYKSILEKKIDPVHQMGALIFNESVSTEYFSEENPYDMTYCDRGSNAVQQVDAAIGQQRPFAVAFVDMRMPGLNGAETARRMWEVDPHLKIVIVTAFSDITPGRITEIVGRKDIFYIRKPFHQEEIEQFARSLTQQWTLEQDQQKLRTELADTNAHLEERIAEQTVALQNAHRMLKILDQEKYQFIQYLSHEINTPLNYIGAKSLIDLEKMTDDERQFMDMIDQGYDRLRNLVQNALYYFSIANIEFRTQKSSISLTKLIHTVVTFYLSEIDNRQLQFEIDVNRLQDILADLQYTNMLIKILIENAIQFSNPGGRIFIIGESVGDRKQLQIRDEGKGIDPGDLEKIFVAFTIEEHKRRVGGYGFNLPIARHICEAQGWHIWAESAGLNQGSQFTIDFKSGQ